MKSWLKNNPITRFLIYFVKLIFSIIKLPFYKYSHEIQHFKNIHKGKRCFIVATGPSLTLADCELLKDEITFGLNSIVKIFGETSWRPTYYVVSDVVPYAACKDLINIDDFEQVFYSSKIDKKNKRVCHFSLNPINVYRCELRDHFQNRIFPAKDLEKYFNDSPSVVFSIIQLAMYMGFSEIYLIGQDCNFAQAKHSDIAKIAYKVEPKVRDGEKIIESFQSYQQYLSKNTNVKIFNATRGGLLEVFERVQVENIVGEKIEK